MFLYQKFLIEETDRFDPSVFPQLEECLQQTVAQLAMTPDGPSTAMIVSFVKDHCMDSQQVKDYPQLAGQISSKALPLSILEHLFESSRQNPVYRKDLEAYVTAYLTTGKMPQPAL
jgi:hypothetical protein